MSVDTKRAREAADRLELYNRDLMPSDNQAAHELERYESVEIMQDLRALADEVERLGEWQRIAEKIPVEDMEDRIALLETEREEVWKPLLRAAIKMDNLVPEMGILEDVIARAEKEVNE